MTKAEKLQTFDYYLRAETCVCGKPKGPMHWSCRPCRRSHDQHPAGKLLDQACEAHVLAARAYLDVLKADAAPGPLITESELKATLGTLNTASQLSPELLNARIQ